MAKGITRTLVTTEISVAKFENGGLLPLEMIIEDREVSQEEAVKIANRKYKEESQVVVTEVKVLPPVKRRISIEDFVKYSEVIEGQDQEESDIDANAMYPNVEESEASGF